MKKHLPAIVAGFAAGVLQIVPIVKSFSCCLIMPAAAFAAVFLYQKSNNLIGTEIKISNAAAIGLFTGIFAAVFGSLFEIFITAVTHTNDIIDSFGALQKMLTELPLSEELKQRVIDIFTSVVEEIKSSGFSLIYAVSIFINNLIVDIIFGLIGGMAGAQILNSRLGRE